MTIFYDDFELVEALAPYKKEEFKKQLQDELYDKFIDLARTPEWGFENLAEIGDYLIPTIEVNDYEGEYDNDIEVEFRAEVNYREMEDVCNTLDKVVKKYDKNAYFEPVQPGIATAYLKLKDSIHESIDDDEESSNLVRDYYNRNHRSTVPDIKTEKYKNFTIKFSKDGTGYSILDKYGEVEDTGFKSKQDAKEWIDEQKLIYPLKNECKLQSHQLQSKKLNEASYGGAFDIEDDQYFTKEEIVEVAEKVCEHLNETYPDKFDVSDVYMETPTIIHVEVISKEGNWVSANAKIDMRKIKKPSDIMKYDVVIGDLVYKLRQELEDLYESFEDARSTSIEERINELFKRKGLSFINVYEIPLKGENTYCIEFDIDHGDWKHEHIRAKLILEEWAESNGYDINIDKDVTYSDGSDVYSAHYEVCFSC